MSGSKEANFDELMRRFQDCASAETRGAMEVLNTTNCADVNAIVKMRMMSAGVNDDFKTVVCTPPKSSIFADAKEQQFAQTVTGLNPVNWIAFVGGIRNWVNQQQAVAAVAAQTVDPRVMLENWDRIRTKLSICDETAQELATQLGLDAFGGCNRLLIILNYRGDAFQHSLFAEPFDFAAETRFVDEVNRVNSVGLTLDRAKWIQFIEYLRHSIRSQYQQPVAPDEYQDASHASEAAVSPTHDREMPIESNVYGPMQLWPQVHELLYDVLSNIFRSGGGVESIYAQQQCNWMIGQVLDKPPSLTPEQLNAIHGAPGMPMVPVLDLKLIFKEAHPQLDDDAAFDYACMAYFVGDPSARERVENYFITIPPALNAFVEQFNNPAQIEVYRMWKRCFMIAQLMYSLTQIVHYDRSGVYADARKRLGSRSIPRGGKSHSKRSKRSNSKRSNSKRRNSKRSNSKRSKRSNSKRSKRSKRSSRR